MAVRIPAVAGRFYDADRVQCQLHIEQMIRQVNIKQQLPENIVAGIVPHAGWMFSGALACMVFEAIRRQHETVDTFVIFGAVHTLSAGCGLIGETGQWQTPLGLMDIDDELRLAILEHAGEWIHIDQGGHHREHSIEVQVPIIQHMFSNSKIVPILVPPIDQAHQIGQRVGEVIAKENKKIVCIGSTDLTHYGPSYLFTPMGESAGAIEWAKTKNDCFFIDLAVGMKADKLVESSRMYGSACGGGAAAATVAVAKQLGAEKGVLLAHTTSAEILEEQFHQTSSDSVGYAAIVFGR